MRCLLIGSTGQLGTALRRVFQDDYELVCTGYEHGQSDVIRLDLGQTEDVRFVLASVQPSLILIAGAMCAVDRCETEPALCQRINVDGPAVVADYASRQGARVVYYSTDHVFDGTREENREEDTVNPLSVYAKSKWAAECVIRETIPDRHLILRTSWVYGPDPQRRNFALRTVAQLTARRAVTVPSDQWGSPTLTEDLAQATKVLLAQHCSGTFHATGPDFLDRQTLAKRICAQFGLDEGLIFAKRTVDLDQPAPRPLRPRLHCGKLFATGVPRFRPVADGLAVLDKAESVEAPH